MTDPNNRLVEDPTYTYYDDEGNRLTRTRKSDGQKWGHSWNHRNRLTRVVETNSGGTVAKQVDYTYDVWDRCIGISVDPHGACSAPARDT